jgi:protein-L-isoaspartate(D-aspartate) O-methyltransferase
MDADQHPLFAAERLAMVKDQLAARGIRDERVLTAMVKTARHEFVPHESWPQAYADSPVAIGEQQTTSQPYIIAVMLEAAEIAPRDRVLEIGAGSGYQTALLSELAVQVFAMERNRVLRAGAQATLEHLGYGNVSLVEGDGSLGLPEHAPFDVIIVAAAAPRIPPALLEQLAPGGRLVVPVGNAQGQVLQVARKRVDGTVAVQTLEACRFVPLIGRQGFTVQ